MRTRLPRYANAGSRSRPCDARSGPNPLGYQLAVGIDQLIDHRVDRVDGQRRAGIRVKHDCLIDVVTPLLERGPHRQLGHVHERPVERRALRGKAADADWMHAITVDLAGHLDAAARWKVVDQALVANIPVLEPGLASDERMDVAGRQLTFALDCEAGALGKACPDSLVFVEVVERALDVLVDGYPVALELIVVSHEPRDVLGTVLARFGREEAELAVELDSDPPAETLGISLDRGVQQRIEALASALEAQDECLVVQPGG